MFKNKKFPVYTVGFSLLAMVLAAAGVGKLSNRYADIAKNLEIFSNTVKIINDEHVDGGDPNKLVRVAIDSMLKSLDPYTNFISEAEVERYRFLENASKTGNVGAKFVKHFTQKGLTIEEVYDGHSAQKAGMQVSDRIIEINGTNIEDKPYDLAAAMLSGSIGSKIKVAYVKSSDNSKQSALLELQQIELPNVPYAGMLPDSTTAYISLSIFTQRASANIADALKRLQKSHKVKSVVIDLRDNGGGLLHEAIDIVNFFVPKGLSIVTTKANVSEQDKTFRSLNEPLDVQMPVMVLINSHSASASEIVSGSLQDLDRAVLIGQRSFGKGLVQNYFELGFNHKVKITTARYYIPSGRCIQALDYTGDGATKIRTTDAFKTVGGRTVYGGGGVSPDLEVESFENSPLTKALREQHCYLDFITNYYNKHPKIEKLDQVKLTDADFNDFLAFLQKRNFSFETETEKALRKLQKKSKAENAQSINDAIQKIDTRLSTQKVNDLQQFKRLILRNLEAELASRYFYFSGRVQVQLRHDDEIKQALALAANNTKYQSFLKK
jgi:carboxyl-terminal processing protease